MNVIKCIHELLSADRVVQSFVKDRIYGYEVTENADKSGPFILIRPIYSEPSTFVSNQYLTEMFMIQVDVQGQIQDEVNQISNRIRAKLWEVGFSQSGSMLDTYFDESQLYLMSRRYRGIPKNQYNNNERIE